MAQLERTRRSCDSPNMSRLPQSSPTFEQLLRVDETNWPANTSPVLGINHDQEEFLSPASHSRKSVLSKVKERAKKLRHSLSGRKKHGSELNDDTVTPAWGVTLEDDEDELDDDPEYLGAPMYESEAAPESLKETARQHPRAVPVVSENHMVPNRKHEAAKEDHTPVSPNNTVTEAVSGKLGPAYAAVSDVTNKVASKIAGLTITTPEAQESATNLPTRTEGRGQERARNTVHFANPGYEAKKTGENSGNLKQYASGSPQKWDKGISVKEYLMNKLEPGEDERALSQAITEAISPRRSTGDSGVVEKVKEAVTSFFWHDEPSNSMAKAASSSSAPVSSKITSSAPLLRSISTKTRSEVYRPASANNSPVPLSSNAHEGGGGLVCIPTSFINPVKKEQNETGIWTLHPDEQAVHIV
ncbi:UNVERIFIED_CONTAM: hypothetical protein Sangu_2842100 [Sesamum angustifolium]|uniref:Low-temperature-induced protein n=1 Tax=Sesamum angustifolium TaxID=2727405 RepID=A0AAW2IQR2_9LAMI